MRSAVYLGPRRIEVCQREIPVPAEDEVLIRVMACGVCGSDVHIFEGDQGSTQTVPPLIPGHEFSGEVVEIGNRVEGFQIGDRVTVDPAKYCNECYYCQNGQVHLCEEMGAIGTNLDGGFSEFAKVPFRLLYPLADDVSYEEGAMAEPLACCIHGMDRIQISLSDNVVIFGGGFIGQLLLQLSLLRGASKVVVVEPIEDKRKMAEEFGAHFTINPLEEDVKRALSDQGMDHIQVVIDTSGRPENYQEAVASGKIDVKKVASHYFHFDQVQEAMTRSVEEKAEIIKSVISFS